MNERLLDLLMNVLGSVAAGLVILWLAERWLEIRKESERRKKEKAAQLRRALTYLGLLHSEVDGIVQVAPGQASTVKMQEWGMAVPIVTPVWDLVEQSGELVSLVNPKVLQQTAWFYEQLAYAKHVLDFLILSWLVPEDSVPEIKKKRVEMQDTVAGYLKTAESSGKELLKAIDSEGRELADRLQGLE